MKITLIAHTRVNRANMEEVTGNQWRPDFFDDGGAALSEFAGRACYQSWRKPNPATATNQGYIANILDHEHFSVLEHGTVTLYIEDVSRSLTHELVRHRHFSPSQLSQRFVMVEKERSDGTSPFVVPPLYRDELGAATATILANAWAHAVDAYDQLVAMWLPRLIQRGVDPHKARKMAREAARCVLPNMTPTAIVLTGNHRAWRDMILKRATPEADAEIREMAVEAYLVLSALEPNLYQDIHQFTVEGVTYLAQDH